MKYTISVDYGKPFEEVFINREEVVKRLFELQKLSNNSEVAYMDIYVYDENDKDISKQFFDENGIIEKEDKKW